jgi:hypothetical protein
LLAGALVSGCEYDDFYVATGGVDCLDPDCGSATRPWQSIQFAIDNASTTRIPRLNVAAGDYVERLNISSAILILGEDRDLVTLQAPTRIPDTPVVIVGSWTDGMSGAGTEPELGDLSDIVGLSDLTIKGWVGTNPSAAAATHVMGIAGVSLTLQNIAFLHPGPHGVDLVDSVFTIRDTTFSNAGYLHWSDLTINADDCIGTIENVFIGYNTDHMINLLGGTYAILDSELVGSPLRYADGIRVQSPSTLTVQNTSIIRPSDAEPFTGTLHNPPYAGIELAFTPAGDSEEDVFIQDCTISGFDVGVGVNVAGARVRLQNNSFLPGNRRADVALLWTAGDPSRIPTVDLGGGSLGSTGGNTFSSGTETPFYAINMADMYGGPLSSDTIPGYTVYAQFNSWPVPAGDIPDLIYDQDDDASLGNVIY